MPRIRRVKTRQKMEKRVEAYITKGYRVKDQDEHSTLMKNKSWGSGTMHIIIFILTFWTLGLCNAAYAAFKYLTGEEVHIVVDDEAE